MQRIFVHKKHVIKGPNDNDISGYSFNSSFFFLIKFSSCSSSSILVSVSIKEVNINFFDIKIGIFHLLSKVNKIPYNFAQIYIIY